MPIKPEEPSARALPKKPKVAETSGSKTQLQHENELLDEALEETFPASDPQAITIDKR